MQARIQRGTENGTVNFAISMYLFDCCKTLDFRYFIKDCGEGNEIVTHINWSDEQTGASAPPSDCTLFLDHLANILTNLFEKIKYGVIWLSSINQSDCRTRSN